MSSNWIDGSSYSSSDKKRIPNVWKINFDLMSITIIYHHVLYPDQWVVSSEPFFRHEELGNISQAEAKTKAIEMVKDQLSIALQEISKEIITDNAG